MLTIPVATFGVFVDFKSDSTNDNSAGGEPHNHYESSANRAFASCRSAVSKPSVNQP
jgi:hypothetical protein